MKDSPETKLNKRGYLNEDFLFFHLNDKRGEQFELHYHDFYKIIIFISGRVTYYIEGKGHSLKPWDILLISNRDIHRAVIDTSEAYERIVIWFKPGFLEKSGSPASNLLICFDRASEERQSLLRLSPVELNTVRDLLEQLQEASESSSFGSDVLKKALFVILSVKLNRFSVKKDRTSLQAVSFDETISKIVTYINTHTSEDLTIENLSKSFYLSKYTLMHKFKRQTGYTIHSFILQKRLLAAGSRIKDGCPAMEAGFECGFSDYSSFVRAFHRFYGVSPGQYKKKAEKDNLF